MPRICFKSFWKYFLLFLFVSAIGGCYVYQKPTRKVTPADALKKVGWWGHPHFVDDLDRGSILAAIEKNNKYLERLPEKRVVRYGDQQYSVKEIKESFLHFVSILNNSENESDLNYKIIRDFNVYYSIGSNSKRRVLFTGYYEPIMKGSREKTEDYQYPIYSKPEDLIEINLGNFRESLKGKRIIARIDEGVVIPYHDRKEIDQAASLSERGLEIAWLVDPLDVFFLHIQGSGIIEMTDGYSMSVNYAAANGKGYRSIGRLLIEEGRVPKEIMSMKSIRDYLHSHPEEMERVLFHNESYVFFREVERGPIGSTAVPLTAGRSIATDTKIFPKGGLAFIETEIPVTDEEGNVTGWKKISRFVVDQDTGGAIKGPGRVDIFFGSGDGAAKLAGDRNRDVKIFYLIKKKSG